MLYPLSYEGSEAEATERIGRLAAALLHRRACVYPSGGREPGGSAYRSRTAPGPVTWRIDPAAASLDSTGDRYAGLVRSGSIR
jgi:hypothetical protein